MSEKQAHLRCFINHAMNMAILHELSALLLPQDYFVLMQ